MFLAKNEWVIVSYHHLRLLLAWRDLSWTLLPGGSTAHIVGGHFGSHILSLVCVAYVIDPMLETAYFPDRLLHYRGSGSRTVPCFLSEVVGVSLDYLRHFPDDHTRCAGQSVPPSLFRQATSLTIFTTCHVLRWGLSFPDFNVSVFAIIVLGRICHPVLQEGFYHDCMERLGLCLPLGSTCLW